MSTHRLLVVPVVAALALTMGACGSGSSSTSAPTTPSAAAVTETFTGTVGQNGTDIHPFTVTTSGYTLMAGYTALSPNAVTSLGLGVGAWDAASSTCGLNLAQNDSAKVGSTAITGSANAGPYCVRAYDGGNVPAGTTISYTVQVQHY